MLQFDLHVHTSFSLDALISPRSLPHLARTHGLDGVAVVDHGTVRGALAAMAAVHAATAFLVIPGAEYPTEYGHVLGLFLHEDLPLGKPGLRRGVPVWPLAEVVAAVHAQGGLAALAHPFQHGWCQIPAEVMIQLDAVEVVNARATRRFPEANRQAAELASRYGLPGWGGSDAHFPPELGRGRTLIPWEGKGDPDLMTLKHLLTSPALQTCTVSANGVIGRFQYWSKVGRILREIRQMGRRWHE